MRLKNQIQRNMLSREMEGIYIICVTYRLKVQELRSRSVFAELIQYYDNIHVIISDNACDPDNRNAAQRFGYDYIDNGCNAGLSRAYNNAIKSIRDDKYWVMLSDDDTWFSREYMEAVERFVEGCGEYRLAAGIIKKTDGSVFSPQKKLLWKNRQSNMIHETGAYDNIVCLNTGLLIHSSVLTRVGLFDEDLFLDMIDYYLMDRLQRLGLCRVMVLPGEIKQDFSADRGTWRDQLQRYRTFRNDYIQFCQKTGKTWCYMILGLIKRKLNIYRQAIWRK